MDKNNVPLLYRVSDKKSLDQDELDYAINLLIEARDIKGNDELMNNLEVEARKKAKVYRNIKSLRDAFNEMALNPGRTRGEDENATDSKTKSNKKNKVD